jgi:hypothetical protein
MENTTYKFDPTTRKALAKAIGDIIGTPAKYLGMPSAAYQIGPDYHLAKDGTLTGPDSLNLMVGLLERGHEPLPDKTFHLITPRGTLLIQERYDTAEEAEAAGYGIYFGHEGRDVYIKPAPDGKTEHSKHFAVVGAPFEQAVAEEAPVAQAPQAEAPAEPETDEVVIEVPLVDFTPEALDRLTAMVAAKEPLLKKAQGLEALPIQVLNDRVAFPWFQSTDGAEVNAYAQLITALCKTAREKKRVTAKAPADGFENEAFAMRVFLIGLGLIGPEYKLVRALCGRNLSGNSVWRFGPPEKALVAAPAEREETGAPVEEAPAEAPVEAPAEEATNTDLFCDE